MRPAIKTQAEQALDATARGLLDEQGIVLLPASDGRYKARKRGTFAATGLFPDLISLLRFLEPSPRDKRWADLMDAATADRAATLAAIRPMPDTAPKFDPYPRRAEVMAWARELRAGQPPSTVPAWVEGQSPATAPDRFLDIPASLGLCPAPVAFVDGWQFFPDPPAPTAPGMPAPVNGDSNFATVILAGPRRKIFGVLIRKRPMQPAGAMTMDPYTRFALVVWDWRGGVWQGVLDTRAGGTPGNVSIVINRRASDRRPHWFGPWFMRPEGMQQARRGIKGIISRPDNEVV